MGTEIQGNSSAVIGSDHVWCNIMYFILISDYLDK